MATQAFAAPNSIGRNSYDRIVERNHVADGGAAACAPRTYAGSLLRQAFRQFADRKGRRSGARQGDAHLRLRHGTALRPHHDVRLAAPQRHRMRLPHRVGETAVSAAGRTEPPASPHRSAAGRSGAHRSDGASAWAYRLHIPDRSFAPTLPPIRMPRHWLRSRPCFQLFASSNLSGGDRRRSEESFIFSRHPLTQFRKQA